MHYYDHDNYWQRIAKQFYQRKLGVFALAVVMTFVLAGIYAPFLASSKPLVVQYDGEWYFPLFRYLFYRGFYTKRLDLFFNLLMFTLPLCVLCYVLLRQRILWLKWAVGGVCLLQFVGFMVIAYGPSIDPAFNKQFSIQRQKDFGKGTFLTWQSTLKTLSPYAKLNMILMYQIEFNQQRKLEKYSQAFAENAQRMGSSSTTMPTLWQRNRDNEDREIQQQEDIMQQSAADSIAYKHAKAVKDYIIQKREWLTSQLSHLKYEVFPLVRPFHWEDDAGGSQSLNQVVPFLELTRVNRKDLAAALIFGVRISLVVGILSVALGLLIGLPVGAVAGYYGGKFDIVVSRLLEIWEGMPVFFMLLMVVAILQTKTIFLVIMVIGLFGWTSFSRYVRGEFFKQRNLPYIEACRAMGYNDARIIFSHILPNALPPVLTLLPFAVMGAITSEAALSFLGLGEEGSCSWGVLMDEGRAAFPSEAYLLWPPAILLTILLVAIALVGDSLRDAMDPKLQRRNVA